MNGEGEPYGGPKPSEVGRVLLNVYCGLCTDQHRADRGRLGQIRVNSDGVWFWIAADRDLGLVAKRTSDVPGYSKLGIVGAQVLRQPQYPDVDLLIPERLPAYCRRHGHGAVPSADVLDGSRAAARGGRRDIAVPLSPNDN